MSQNNKKLRLDEEGTSLQKSSGAYSQWNGIPGSEHVKKVTDANVGQYISKHDSVLVLFYVPWCPYCTEMQPDFANAAAALHQESPTTILAAINCVEYPRALKRFQVKGYPSMKYFRHGRFIGDYNQSRKSGNIVNFMLRAPNSRDEIQNP